MEIIVRIAISKYFKTKRVACEFEAVEKLFEDHMLSFLDTFNWQKWREEKLWNLECSDWLQKYHDTLIKLFEKHSGKYTKPGNPVGMSIEEFIEVVTDSSITVTEPGIGNSELGSQFSMAMSTQINELDSDRHFQMQLEEFVEAIARVADKVNNFPPIPTMINRETGSQNKKVPLLKASDTTIIDRNITNDDSKVDRMKVINMEGEPLHLKLEVFLSRLKLLAK